MAKGSLWKVVNVDALLVEREAGDRVDWLDIVFDAFVTKDSERAIAGESADYTPPPRSWKYGFTL